jgi:N-acetylglucosaminyldiphosphoundecaprenol N-acetyl-beta-D-mannosaminyltransferase
LRFAGRGPLRSLAVWLNVLRGDMAVVGPRALTLDEAAGVPVPDQVRFLVRPGLVSPFGVRSRIGIAHLRESALDRDFVYGQTLKGDVGLAARSVVTGVLGADAGADRPAPAVLNFFGIPIVNTTMAEAVDWVIAAATRNSGARQMAFVNPDCLNIAWGHAEYRRALRDAERVLPDGIGIHIGCRMRGQMLRENVNGTDLFPLLCEAAANTGHSLYLLGARPGIAAAAAEQMQQRFPALKIAGTRAGYFAAADEPAVIDAINASGADILLVAFGAPRQDLWIAANRARLEVGIAFGVGGLLDFYSGRIRRAPLWLRELGLEWVYRLLQEPGRMWRRYVIGNPLFLFRVWRQTLHPERFPLPAAGATAPDSGRPTQRRI